MGFKRRKFYICLAIIYFSLDYTKGSCDMTTLPKYSSNRCVASLQCDQVISFVPSSWSCIKHSTDVNKYDYYYERYRIHTEVTYDKDYTLYVNVKNVDDEHDIFESVVGIIQNIKTFQINNGSILALPREIHQLSEATKIEISNTQLSTLDLNSFVPLAKLATLNFSNNSISALNTTPEKYLVSRSVKTIDLSQNNLETIPNTAFSLYTGLQNLNLSHNRISSFNILTFEGVMELKILDVSHNMLSQFGNSFTRFLNLNELYLQNNMLVTLTDYNLSTLSKLEMLNLSSNLIDKLEDTTFKSLIMLKYLDFSDNKVKTIPKNLFEKNTDLHSLLVSKNHIIHVENGAFDGKNITKFNIQFNNLTGSIVKDTFKGVHVTELDLSNGSITSLGDETFQNMCPDLNSLNFSSNSINSVSHSAFTCLQKLTVLDLSHNRLEELNFNTSSLKSLSKLYACNNKIKKISKNVYGNLVSLTRLDLSYNEITEIELQSFEGLENINTLLVMHNPFVNTLQNFTFNGLIALESLDLSFISTTSYQNGSFSGLPALKHLNSTFGQLSTIDFNAFIHTGSITKLDFSFNLLEVFHINTSCISKVEEIYLNNNLIRHVTNETFSDLKLLRLLNLANNNIQKMEAFAFKNVAKLSHLCLSSNMQMEIIGNPFDSLTNLYQVNLDNVKTEFTFQNTTSIENLDLHSCGIQDLNKLSIYNVGNLRELNLSSNKIWKIDKFSFRSLPSLIKLDLSFNKISYIQPGSFLQVGELRKLTLFGNNLQTLQFGVLDGIKALHDVILSSNALQSFEAKLLPVATSIALDNNDISHLNFKEIFESGIHELSIGGNPISCKVLTELKTSNYSKQYKKVVTTAALEFHTENVDGISCQSDAKGNGIVLPAFNNSGYDVKPMFIHFSNAIESLRSSLEILGNNTLPEKSHELTSDVSKLVNSIQALVNISNQTQIKSGEYFHKMEKVTNITQSHLEDIKDQLTNLTFKAEGLTSSNNVNNNGINENIRLEIKQMLKEKIDAIREEFGNTFQTFQRRDSIPQAQVTQKGSLDEKVMYFIAACLGMIIVLYVINFAYGFIKRGRSNSLHSSRRPIASELEMG